MSTIQIIERLVCAFEIGIVLGFLIIFILFIRLFIKYDRIP